MADRTRDTDPREVIARVLHDHGDLSEGRDCTEDWRDCSRADIHGAVARRIADAIRVTRDTDRGALPLDVALAEMKRSVEHARRLYFESRDEVEHLRAENGDLVEANQRLRRQYENLRERVPASEAEDG